MKGYYSTTWHIVKSNLPTPKRPINCINRKKHFSLLYCNAMVQIVLIRWQLITVNRVSDKWHIFQRIVFIQNFGSYRLLLTISFFSLLYRNNGVPDLHALLRNANEKLSAALEPTLARLIVAFSVIFELQLKSSIFLTA